MINNNGTKTIITKRIILRKFKLDDYSSFVKNVGDDPEVSKYVVWNRHNNVEVIKKAVAK